MAKKSLPNFVPAMVLRDNWLEQAQQDLYSEVEYVYNEFGTKAAENVYRKIKDGVDHLRYFPGLGRHYEGLFYRGAKVRVLSQKRLSIIYCHNNDVLTIVAIWNNWQNPSILKDMLAER